MSSGRLIQTEARVAHDLLETPHVGGGDDREANSSKPIRPGRKETCPGPRAVLEGRGESIVLSERKDAMRLLTTVVLAAAVMAANVLVGTSPAVARDSSANECHEHLTPTSTGESPATPSLPSLSQNAGHSPAAHVWGWRYVTHFGCGWTGYYFVVIGGYTSLRCVHCGYFFSAYVPF